MGRRKGDERFMVQCKQVTSGALASIRKHGYFYSPRSVIPHRLRDFPRVSFISDVNVAS